MTSQKLVSSIFMYVFELNYNTFLIEMVVVVPTKILIERLGYFITFKHFFHAMRFRDGLCCITLYTVHIIHISYTEVPKIFQTYIIIYGWLLLEICFTNAICFLNNDILIKLQNMGSDFHENSHLLL